MPLTKITRGALATKIINQDKIDDLAVDTAQLAGDAVTNAKIDDGAVDTEHLADDAVEAAELASNAVVNASVASNANIAGSKLDTSVLENNIAMLGFYRAVDGSKAKYSLVDQVIDDFQDATGIDTGSSLNETLTSGYYGGTINTQTYIGDGSDGDYTTSGNVSYTVANTNGSYDGDMVVKNYEDFTIASGHTVTTAQPCRGLLIYVKGDCVINGTLTMTGRGALANPTASGGSDNSAVHANGITWGVKGTGNDTLPTPNFAGCGSAAVAAMANQSTGTGTTIVIQRAGGSGGATSSDGSGYRSGNAGAAGNSDATLNSGGGGSGAAHFGQNSGAGAAGTCFAGGSGGGGVTGDHDGGGGPQHNKPGATYVRDIGFGGGVAGSGVAYGGAGGAGNANMSSGAGGGAGNPSGVATHTTNQNVSQTIGDGVGGLLILIVSGELSGSGTISSNGSAGGSTGTAYKNCGGGGSGGGNVVVLRGTNNNGPTPIVTGGAGGAGHIGGGAGGAGSAYELTGISEASYESLTLISNATTAESAPDTGDIIILIEDSAGTATINTDIKAYISRDGSAFSSEVVLLDEGDWGTNKRILAAHDVDISGITSGTSMKYKITTHNQAANKETRVHAVSLAWS